MADYLDGDFIKGTEYLNGFLKGILSDRLINKLELQHLAEWIELHRKDMGGTYPFDEIDHLVCEALSSKRVIKEEIFEEITSFLKDIQKEIIILSATSTVSSKIREFKGLLAGIFADHRVAKREAFEIKKWLDEHADFMQQHWSLVELKKKVESLLVLGKISARDSENIIAFCRVFEAEDAFEEELEFESETKLASFAEKHLSELYSESHIEFHQKVFSFAGAMEVKREKVKALLESAGGIYSDSVHDEVDYLVVGKNANPRISQSTYGLKLESAMNLNIPILSEEIFMASLNKNS